jgi:transcriptional regulator with XRE-family HTH domain
MTSVGLKWPRLRSWRIEAELTLEEVADLTGLSLSFLSLLERGKRQARPATKVAMARRLGVPVRDLFGVDPLDDEGPGYVAAPVLSEPAAATKEVTTGGGGT